MDTPMRPLPAEPCAPATALVADFESVCQAGSLCILDEQGTLELSPGLRRLVGLDPQAPAGTLETVDWIPEAERRLVAHLWRQATPGQPFEIQLHLLTRDGRSLLVHHRGTREATADGGLRGHAVLHDVSVLHAQRQRIEELSHAHETTGLPNRTGLLNRLENAVATSGGDGRGFSVLSVAVPRIAELAGSMGFVAADHLANELAQRLVALHTAEEWIAQLGPTEFALVVRHPRAHGTDAIRARAHELVACLVAPVSLGGIDVFPSCRVGVAIFPQDGQTGQQILEAAQAARNEAGTDADIAFHSTRSTAQVLREMQIESRMRQALANGEFVLAYQPQLSLKTGAIVGVEALLRWRSSQGETYPPSEFIPVAERTGLVAPLGEWVMQEACAQVVRWRERGLPPLRTAINLSPVQFQVGDVAQSLTRAMAATGALPSELCLEVTEGALLHDADRVNATLGKLHQAGIEIALDDFGTGYSSLGRLRTLPIDVLKIDRSFVKDITAEADSAAIIRAIIHLAHSLGIQVLAEGVETEGQVSMLLNSGCDQMQGFFFSRAVDADEIARMLEERRQLPPELTQNHTQSRTLLLVDDEENILAALRRLFRRDGYKILTASSGTQALELLATTEVDVIISDQRMPGMAGVDFLRRAKDLWPDTIRMTLSGFTDLQSIIDAVNEGAVFKFLTKPWDDARLREHVAQAFRQKELADENRRLNQKLASASADQAALNRQLEALLAQQRQDNDLAQAGAGGVRELLERLPAAVVGVDPEGVLAFLNRRAGELFPEAAAGLGEPPEGPLQALIDQMHDPGRRDGEGQLLELGSHCWRAWISRLDDGPLDRGEMIVFMPCCQKDAA